MKKIQFRMEGDYFMNRLVCPCGSVHFYAGYSGPAEQWERIHQACLDVRNAQISTSDADGTGSRSQNG